MPVGIPGTGLGGVLYIVLSLWMMARESWLTLRGRGTAHRRRMALAHAAMALAMVAALWGSAQLMSLALQWVGGSEQALRVGVHAARDGGLASLGALAIAACLLALLVGFLRLMQAAIPRPQPAVRPMAAVEARS